MSGALRTRGARHNAATSPGNSNCAANLIGPKDLFDLLLLLDRALFLLPEIVPTQQRCRVFDSFCLESDHRTGGRMFGLSRTVGDNHLVTRKLVQVVKDLAGRDELGAGNVSLVK